MAKKGELVDGKSLDDALACLDSRVDRIYHRTKNRMAHLVGLAFFHKSH